MFVIYVTDPNKINEKHKPDYEFVGAAVSESTANPGPQPAGYGVTDTPKTPGQIWNPATLAFDDRPPQTIYSAQQFFDLFTDAEKMAYWGADSTIDPVRRALSDFTTMEKLIDRTAPTTVAMLSILVAAGEITDERKTEIST